MKHYNERNFTEAKVLFEQSADDGNPDAHFMLGVLYHFGYGVERDTVTAKKYYERAAKQNHGSAQDNLDSLEAIEKFNSQSAAG
jgi:TPR repeat protein